MITIQNNIIRITLDSWRPDAIELLRRLPSRRYVPAEKCWLVPKEYARAIARIFPDDLEVERVAAENVARHRKLQEIQASQDAVIDSRLPLYPFQNVAVAFLREAFSGVVSLDVGCGKTLVALDMIDRGNFPALVFAPKTLLWQWHQEIKHWLGKDAVVVAGNAPTRADLWAQEGEIVLANYELLLNDLEHIKKREWKIVVCDEATRISNTRTKTWKSLMQIPCEKRVALTGTPISNMPVDVYGIVSWTNPMALGTFTQFINRYAYYGMFGEIRGYKNLDELATRLKPYIFRRTIVECLPNLPKKTVVEVPFSLNKPEREFYNKVREGILHEIEPDLLSKIDIITLSTTLVKLLRLQQITDSMELVGKNKSSSKLEVLQELLAQNNASGQKTIVYTKFAQMAFIIQRELALLGYNPAIITGTTNDRIAQISRFEADSECKTLIITDAAAYGLNLQKACSAIILYDLPYSAAKLSQIEGRVHRMGQQKKVMIYHLLAEKTVDVWLKRLLGRKLTLADKVLASDVKDLLRGTF